MASDDHPGRDLVEAPSSSTDRPPAPRRATGLEATELARIRSNYSHASATNHPASSSISQKPSGTFRRFQYELAKFWRNQISLAVPHDSCRDHLALERTFLGYLRTSLAISMIGVTVAQLFRLQHAPDPNALFGFYVLGKPLSAICQGVAIYTLVIGAFRCWRTQNALARGKVIAGGIELLLVGFGVMIMCIMFFVLVIAVNIDKDETDELST